MGNQDKRSINDLIVGHLASEMFTHKQRLENLENKKNDTESNTVFGMHPMIAMGVVTSFLIVSFGSVFAWQVGRIDSAHKTTIERMDSANKATVERVSKEYESRISWLKEQQEKNSGFSDKQCKYQLTMSNNKLSTCISKNKKITTQLRSVAVEFSAKGS